MYKYAIYKYKINVQQTYQITTTKNTIILSQNAVHNDS